MQLNRQAVCETQVFVEQQLKKERKKVFQIPKLTPEICQDIYNVLAFVI